MSDGLFPGTPHDVSAVLGFGPRTKLENVIVEESDDYELVWWEFENCEILTVRYTIDFGQPPS